MAEVQRTLASVRKLCQAGDRVVFDREGSYIQNTSTGNNTVIQEGHNGYTVGIWVPERQDGTTGLSRAWHRTVRPKGYVLGT